MKALLAPNSCGAALAFPKATAIRSYQHQMFDHGSAGAIALGVRHGQAPAVVYDKTQDRRLGRGDAPRSFFNSHRLAFFSPSRRPVLDPTSSGIGLHSPAERIRAARGAFFFMRVSDCRPARAQSLAHQQTVNSIADVPHVQLRLSSKSSLRPDHHGRSEKGWRYQIPVMRCPA